MHIIKEYRNFIKDTIRKKINFRESDQSKGVPVPPMEEVLAEDILRIRLPEREVWEQRIEELDVKSAIGMRQSRRRFNGEYLAMHELAFLLWATQGQRNPDGSSPHYRTVPSAGARHSFETYLFINRVESIPPGLYRYLPLSGELALLAETDVATRSKLVSAVFGQKFIADGAVVFIWATVPYRMEWRYLEAAHRVILIDAGHVCQNLYLACESILAGTCAIAAYDQEALDALLGLDGEDQFTVYLAPVGKY